MNLEIVTIFLTLVSSKASLNIWFQLTSIRIIFRDYLTVVLVIDEVSTPDHIISPKV